MGMHPPLGGRTETHTRRLFFIKEIGCIACIKRFGAAGPGGDGHHAEDGKGTVIGHHAMLCLCPEHHHQPTSASYRKKGPSRHIHTVEFTAEFGTDEQLLEFQNQVLSAYLDTFVIRPDVG